MVTCQRVIARKSVILVAAVFLIVLRIVLDSVYQKIVLNIPSETQYYNRYLASSRNGKEICSTGNYAFEFTDEVHRRPGPRSWEEVANLPCKYINLGADRCRHGGEPNYWNYVGVQGPPGSGGWGTHWNATTQRHECGEWCVVHDMMLPIPLPNSSVDRIHSEDMMEHIDQKYYPGLLKEIHRLLKPGGRARIGVPDYTTFRNMEAWPDNYKEFPDALHKVLTNYALMDKYIKQSPFRKADWLIYTDNTVPGITSPSRFLPEGSFINSRDDPLPFIHKNIDYTLGMISRAPDVDWRNSIFRPNFVSCLAFDLVKDSETSSMQKDSVVKFSRTSVRYIGDPVHLIGVVALLLTLAQHGACTGISRSTWVLYFCVYATRSLVLVLPNIQTASQTLYSTFFYLTFLITSAMVLAFFYQFDTTYEKTKDTCSLVIIFAPCIVLGVSCSNGAAGTYEIIEICWAFSQLLEGFAMVPQYIFCYRDLRLRSSLGIDLYVVSHGGYRFLYTLNWLYTKIQIPASSPIQSWIGCIFETLMFIDYLNCRVCGHSMLRKVVLSADGYFHRQSRPLMEIGSDMERDI